MKWFVLATVALVIILPSRAAAQNTPSARRVVRSGVATLERPLADASEQEQFSAADAQPKQPVVSPTIAARHSDTERAAANADSLERAAIDTKPRSLNHRRRGSNDHRPTDPIRTERQVAWDGESAAKEVEPSGDRPETPAAVAPHDHSDLRTASSNSKDRPASDLSISRGELVPTPEMWYYEQALQQYNNPRLAVRAKSEFRTAQRQRRMAARQWFGLSNLRPLASATPIMGTYSPHWSGNTFDASRWSGDAASAALVVETDRRSLPSQPRAW